MISHSEIDFQNFIVNVGVFFISLRIKLTGCNCTFEVFFFAKWNIQYFDLQQQNHAVRPYFVDFCIL